MTEDREEQKRQGRPGFVLADAIDGDFSPPKAVDCYVTLRTWSRTKYKLTQWMTTLRRELGPDLRLIVWDDTDFGIPWELFWHDMDEAPAWLGTVVQIIRWTTVHDDNRHAQFNAQESRAIGGRILYYEDPSLTGPSMTIHSPVGHPGYKKALTMKDLLDELTGTNTYALVYIRGHGHHSTDVRKSTMAGVRLSDISGRKFPVLRQSRSLVFLNACNSARQFIDKRLADNSYQSFVEVFLHQRASAVVASMAEVPSGHSAWVAHEIIVTARADGVRIPEYLRAHRALHAKNLPEPAPDLGKSDERKISEFIYASVFAYFGHPESVFKLDDSWPAQP